MKAKNCYNELVRSSELIYKTLRNIELVPNNRTIYKPLMDISMEGQAVISSILSQHGHLLNIWLDDTDYYSEIANYNSILEGSILVVDLFNNLSSFSRILQYSKYENSIKELVGKTVLALKNIEKIPIEKYIRKIKRSPTTIKRTDSGKESGIIKLEIIGSEDLYHQSIYKTLPDPPSGTLIKVSAKEQLEAIEDSKYNMLHIRSEEKAREASPPGTAISVLDEYLTMGTSQNDLSKEFPENLVPQDHSTMKSHSVLHDVKETSINNSKVDSNQNENIPWLDPHDISLPNMADESFFLTSMTEDCKVSSQESYNCTPDIIINKADSEVLIGKVGYERENVSISDLDISMIETDMLSKPDNLSQDDIENQMIKSSGANLYESQILEISLSKYRGLQSSENPQIIFDEAMELHTEASEKSRKMAFDKFEYIHNHFEYPQATYFLGYYYYWGYGTSKDRQKAVNLFTEAVKMNSSDAMDHLGIHYSLSGDHNRAFHFYSMASNTSNSKAFYHLYECYLHGLGTEKSIPTALSYLKKAARAGHPKACKKFEVYLNKSIVSSNS